MRDYYFSRKPLNSFRRQPESRGSRHSVRFKFGVFAGIFLAVMIIELALSASAETIKLGSRLDIPLPGRPYWVASGDFNGDGLGDLAVTLYSEMTLLVKLATGEEGVYEDTRYQMLSVASGVWTRDLDEDGDIDIIVAGTGASGLTFLFNSGDGTFMEDVMLPLSASVGALAITENYGDGSVGLVIAAGWGSGAHLLSHRLAADRSFQLLDSIPLTRNVTDMALYDFDGDHDSDLILVQPLLQRLIVLSNIGNGAFTQDTIIQVSGNPNSVVVGDLDTDSDLDFAVVCSNSNLLIAFLRTSEGSFETMTLSLADSDPNHVIALDLDSDLDLDMVITHKAASMLSIWMNGGSSNFARLASLPTGENPYRTAVANLSRSGGIDLVCANINSNTLSIFTATSGRGYPASLSGKFPGVCRSMCTADFDGDGFSDVAVGSVLSEWESRIVVLKQTAQSLDSIYGLVRGADLVNMAAADMDSDGDVDLLSTHYYNEVFVHKNRGDGTFAAPTMFVTGLSPTSLEVCDFNRDGDPDVFVGNAVPAHSGGFKYFENNGVGGLLPAKLIPFEYPCNAVAKGDFDADGDTDILAAGGAIDSIYFVANDGNDSFVVEHASLSYFEVISLTSSDFDGDGDPDVAVLDTSGTTLLLLTNNGFGQFAFDQTLLVAGVAHSISSGDLDNDGDFDLVTTNEFMDCVSIYSNDGDAHFEKSVEFGTRLGPIAIQLQDVDKDGDVDIAVLNRQSSTVEFIANLTGILTGVEPGVEPGVRRLSILGQNFPNPFNQSTKIRFTTSARSDFELVIYNMLGQSVRVLGRGEIGAGEHTFSWDGTQSSGEPAASGIYLYVLRTSCCQESQKMLLLK